ncbi:MAG TPA: DUF5343 domain-containing protein [Ktedonobacterales bacterium]|jgi:hypothetical protein
MAVAKVETKKTSYPIVYTSNWWDLRRKFKKSVPDRVTKNYLALILNRQVASARNLIPPLKKLGLIDQDGKPTPRAIRWRDDDQYPAVCEEIRKEIYPDLAAAFPDSNPPRSPIERWFASETGVGENAARDMADFYLLLCEADPTKQDNNHIPTKSRSRTTAPKTSILRAKSGGKLQPATEPDVLQSNSTEEEVVSPAKYAVGRFQPALNINIEIHIPSDATQQQIDHIFYSMAKHLYR